MNRNLYFLANDQLFRYHGITQEVDLLTGWDGQLPPEDIAYITPASDMLMILTQDVNDVQGLWRYGSD